MDDMIEALHLKVYDPRDQQYKVSNHPALILGDMMKLNGIDVDWERIGCLADVLDELHYSRYRSIYPIINED